MTPTSSTPSLSKSALFSATSSIGLPMPPLVDEDHLAAEQLRDARIREIENGADAGVAGAFDDDEILFPRRAVEGVLDAADEEFVVLVLDVAPREIRLDGDRAHRLERRLHAESLIDQHGVFVDALPIDFDEALPDRLDEADAAAALCAAPQTVRAKWSSCRRSAAWRRRRRAGSCVFIRSGRRLRFRRIELAIFDRLQAEDRRHAEDVVLGRAARHVGARLGEAEQDLAVGFRAGEVLHELGADVAAVEVGKDRARWPCPATRLSAAFVSARSGSSAVSACISPSISISMRAASALLPRERGGRGDFFAARRSCALPLVEKLSMAMRGLLPVSWRQIVPVCTAIVASCSTVGSGMTAQSAKNITPRSP